MRGVVVDGADDHAAHPGQGGAERRPLERARLIARFHVLHLSGTAGGDPFPKAIQFAELVDGRNAGQFKAGGVGCLLHQARNLAALIHSQELEPPEPGGSRLGRVPI